MSLLVIGTLASDTAEHVLAPPVHGLDGVVGEGSDDEERHACLGGVRGIVGVLARLAHGASSARQQEEQPAEQADRDHAQPYTDARGDAQGEKSALLLEQL